ncbi:MAG TPA: glycerol-3-phosphate dehydrogenase/oxidase [Thermoanaerobaculia bacterium]|nr:glycerol-3-phosphate dehydrogenase/oxidase [Thermoanaerobaculia bacterium]
MRLAVIGGGINGAGIAWELARRDYGVTLFEKGRCGAQTSSATTKMIHGGLRYLERFHIALVRESLRDRAWLLEHLPSLVKPIEILLPIYEDSPRSRFTISAGLTLYDLLAGRDNIARHKALNADELIARVPLTRAGLRGGFVYSDAQVDDHALARIVVASAVNDGVTVREETPVTSLRRDGSDWIVATPFGTERFDFVVNAAGPWMNALLAENHIRSHYRLSLVRGSHLVLRRQVAEAGMLLQSLSDRRVFFVLPWKGTTLVGTTEVMHIGSLENVTATEDEIEYLIARFNRYLREPIGRDDIASTFAGVRPLVGRAANPSAIARDYRLERPGNLLNVFGGKMTTFRSLAEKAGMRVDNYFGKVRTARPATFIPAG